MRSLRGLVFVAVLTFGSAALADSVFIDFETLPDGSPSPGGDPIAESYADWGVSFWEIAYGPGQPIFRAGYGADGLFAGAFVCGGYPPGFNIVADFSEPVYIVSADVMSAYDVTVTMLAKDADGTVIGSAESDSLPQFWKGDLSITTATPVASVEWWPSEQTSSVGVDNLFFDIPEPATISLAGVGALLIACRRR